VYALDLSLFKPAEKGNVVFTLKEHLNAREVVLTGSFNGWDEHAIKMKYGPNGWYLAGELPPGRYEYKFIADGHWLNDPAAKENVTNEHGTLNSVLYVTKPVTITLKGYPDASKVIVTGSFTNWLETKHRMININGVWTTTIPLTGGKHLYKFIIDGQWHTDPANPLLEDDGYGNLNSVLFVH
jgi:1,4-alpha-glucan branching enzyme